MKAHFTLHSIPVCHKASERIKQTGSHVHFPYLQSSPAFCSHPNILDVCKRLLLFPVIKKKFFCPTELRGLHIYLSKY